MAGECFKFQFVSNYNVFNAIEEKSKGALELFEKWGMKNQMKSYTFFFNKHFQSYQKDTFTKDFFNDPTVNQTLEVLTSLDQWIPLNAQVTHVVAQPVNCNITSMSFFDTLKKSGVVRESGHIVKCFDETFEDFLISDELRKILLDDESAAYGEFSEQDRSEFIFKIFKHIVLGGPVNQYEDIIKPYLDMAKLLYKELVSVAKDSNNHLTVTSTILSVQAKCGDTLMFPSATSHTQTFSYLIIDNIKRHLFKNTRQEMPPH